MSLTKVLSDVIDVPNVSIALALDTTTNGIVDYINSRVISVNNLALTGIPTAPTAAPGTNTTQLATTEFVETGLNLKANILSPTLTGIPTAPTAAPGTNTTQLATTAFTTYAVNTAAAMSTYGPRQTILHGPIDSNGYSNFGGTTGGAVVTASGTITVSAASGISNYIGTITNPSWSVSTNGILFLFLRVNNDGTCTPYITANMAPIYQWAGTPSIANGQFTFNIQNMTGYMGNGTTAVANTYVCVGEINVASGICTAITWYSVMGRARVTQTGLALSTSYTKIINIGHMSYSIADAWLVCTSTDNGYSVGDKVSIAGIAIGGAGIQVTNSGRNTLTISTCSTGIGQLTPKHGGANVWPTVAKWDIEIIIKTLF